ncbi:MAG: hypothetical protein E6J75_16975, partial [Deltaproteobacteria bacterium]
MKSTVRKKTYNLDAEMIDRGGHPDRSPQGPRGPRDRGRVGSAPESRPLSDHLPLKYLLDTNVYLEAVRSSQQQARFRQTFFPLLPATYLSAVVAYEPGVDAGDRRTRGLVRDFVRPMVASKRVVAPAFEDWQQAAGIVTSIGERDRGWRSKLPTLVNNILIAL